MRKYVAVLSASVLAVGLAGSTSQTATVAADGPRLSTAAAEGIQSATAAARGTFGAIQVVCRSSHSNHDDPIVYPRQKGAAHQHDFFGNRSTNAYSTRASLGGKRTTCSRDGDTAAYWTPTLFNHGRRVVPDRLIAYYRTSRIRDIQSIRPFPRGLKMIAGTALGTKSNPQRTKYVNWNCGDGVYGTRTPPAACPNKALRLRVEFPNCWNGRTLDSLNHKNHMRYAGNGDTRGCPASHPVPVPALSLNFRYKIDGPLDDVRLSSKGVYSAHADFFNAWVQPVLARLVRNCLNRGRVCNSGIADAPKIAVSPSEPGHWESGEHVHGH